MLFEEIFKYKILKNRFNYFYEIKIVIKDTTYYYYYSIEIFFLSRYHIQSNNINN